MRELLNAAKALADQNRLRAIGLLRRKELCLCQIAEVLQLAPSTASRHMAILHQARLVDARKEGRWAYFRLPDPPQTPQPARDALEFALAALQREKEAAADQKTLQAVLKIKPEELCRRQSNCKC